MRHFSSSTQINHCIFIGYSNAPACDYWHETANAIVRVAGYDRKTAPAAYEECIAVLERKLGDDENRFLTYAEVQMCVRAREFVENVVTRWSSAPAIHVCHNLNEGTSCAFINFLLIS